MGISYMSIFLIYNKRSSILNPKIPHTSDNQELLEEVAIIRGERDKSILTFIYNAFHSRIPLRVKM